MWPFGSGGDPLGFCFSHLSVLQMANCIIIIIAIISFFITIIENIIIVPSLFLSWFIIIILIINMIITIYAITVVIAINVIPLESLYLMTTSWLTYFTMKRPRLIGKYFHLIDQADCSVSISGLDERKRDSFLQTKPVLSRFTSA